MLLSKALESLAPIPCMDSDEARAEWASYRVANGFGPIAPLLTPPAWNTKLAKGTKIGVADYGLCLAPANLSGHNVCPFSTPDCRRGCVAFAGKGELPRVIAARVLKTRFLADHPSAFVTILRDEIKRAHDKHGDALAVRLNAFSDLRWERIAPWIFTMFADVQFYDYTKDWNRTLNLPLNYHLTLSVSERTKTGDAVASHAQGSNLAIIFDTKKGHDLPESWFGIRVIDGDVNDARYLDPRCVVVGLRAKGRMRSGDFAMVRSGAM